MRIEYRADGDDQIEIAMKEELHVEGDRNETIHQNRRPSGCDHSEKKSEQGVFAILSTYIENGSGEDVRQSKEHVCELADEGGASHREFQQAFENDDESARQGSHREACEDRGELGELHFQKTREDGKFEFQKSIQYEGDRRQ